MILYQRAYTTYTVTSLTLDTYTIIAVSFYKYLGRPIHLDSKLSFSSHIAKFIHLALHKLHLFGKIRISINQISALLILKAMLLPVIDYGDVIYICQPAKEI